MKSKFNWLAFDFGLVIIALLWLSGVSAGYQLARGFHQSFTAGLAEPVNLAFIIPILAVLVLALGCFAWYAPRARKRRLALRRNEAKSKNRGSKKRFV